MPFPPPSIRYPASSHGPYRTLGAPRPAMLGSGAFIKYANRSPICSSESRFAKPSGIAEILLGCTSSISSAFSSNLLRVGLQHRQAAVRILGYDAGVRFSAGRDDLARVLIRHHLVRIHDRLQNFFLLEPLRYGRQIRPDPIRPSPLNRWQLTHWASWNTCAAASGATGLALRRIQVRIAALRSSICWAEIPSAARPAVRSGTSSCTTFAMRLTSRRPEHPHCRALRPTHFSINSATISPPIVLHSQSEQDRVAVRLRSLRLLVHLRERADDFMRRFTVDGPQRVDKYHPRLLIRMLRQAHRDRRPAFRIVIVHIRRYFSDSASPPAPEHGDDADAQPRDWFTRFAVQPLIERANLCVAHPCPGSPAARPTPRAPTSDSLRQQQSIAGVRSASASRRNRERRIRCNRQGCAHPRSPRTVSKYRSMISLSVVSQPVLIRGA